MTRLYLKTFPILVIAIFSLACNKSAEVDNIGETEYYFDEKLSSISLDPDGSFWVGDETGDIFNFKDNYRVSFDLGEDRIYKVQREVTEEGDTLFWIGVRNSGLQKWTKREGNKLEKLTTYTIDFKKDKYSPYDFVDIKNTIYIATTQGVYSFDKNSKEDSLSLIYPSRDFLSKQNGTPFVVNNICQYKDSLLLASTQKGVFIYDLQKQTINFIHEGQYIEHVSIYSDTIFTVTQQDLHLDNLKGDLLKTISVGHTPKLYYQTRGIHYLVGSEDLFLSYDLNIFSRVHLRRNVPTKNRNIILPDTLNNYTYLLTENAVWRISNNIDIFKNHKTIKASCSTSDNIYYLSINNELYIQKKNESRAKWIHTFAEENQIQWVSAVNDELYLYNTDNEFQKIKVSNNWISNILFRKPEIILNADAKITAATTIGQGDNFFSYLGIQDGLVRIDRANKIESIPELETAYITSMFSHENTGRLYIATLNDGVYYIGLDNQVKQIANTETSSFIQDIIATNEHNSNLIRLTNQQIISQNPKDSVRVKGYKKLIFANDTLFYALPEFGVQKFTISNGKIIDKGIFYKDIRFNKNGSFATNDRLILGSDLGSLYLPINKEKTPIWVSFEDTWSINKLYTISFAILLILLASLATAILLRKQNANITQIRKRKEDLSKRIDDLTLFSTVLYDDNENNEINNLKTSIESIDINSKNKDNSNSLLETISLQIGKLNRNLGLLLPQKIEGQIELISQTTSFDKVSLMKQSEEAKNSNDIDLIKKQIRVNESWIHEHADLFEAVNRHITNLHNTVEIEGINKLLYENLTSIKENEKHQSVSELASLYNTLKDEIENINSPQSRLLIESYISDLRVYLDEKTAGDRGLSFLLNSLDKLERDYYSSDNTSVLKKLKPINDQVLILKDLDDIKLQAKEYRQINDSVIRENNQQINKKFDTELARIISDKTHNVVHQIDILIGSLYEKLAITDKKIFDDVLKFSNFQGQHAKVLALLISDLKIKRSLIPGMLGLYSNLNPLISRLINDRIRTNESILKEYKESEKKNSVFVHYILSLLE